MTDEQKSECGAFKLTKTVVAAWQKTLECADALDAGAILLQCPASFAPTKTNVRNLRRFFAAVDRPADALIAWEPRGAWNSDLVAELCAELSFAHAVDPFETQSVTGGYYRLHGIGGWRYKYTDEDLLSLRSRLNSLTKNRVYFNNASMVQDAIRFRTITAGS